MQYPLLHYRSQQGSCQGREQHQAAMDICLLAIPMMVIRMRMRKVMMIMVMMIEMMMVVIRMRMRKVMMLINDGDDDSE